VSGLLPDGRGERARLPVVLTHHTAQEGLPKTWHGLLPSINAGESTMTRASSAHVAHWMHARAMLHIGCMHRLWQSTNGGSPTLKDRILSSGTADRILASCCSAMRTVSWNMLSPRMSLQRQEGAVTAADEPAAAGGSSDGC
jgi:hypothetical protein